MTTYTLMVTDIKVRPEYEGFEQVVYEVGWLYKGTTDRREVAYGGTTTLAFDPKKDFVPMGKLTEEMVAGWVQAAWSPEEAAIYKNAIDQGLDPTNEPVPLPWQK